MRSATSAPAFEPVVSLGEGIVIRPFETLGDYRACVALQEETWGAGFSETVPVSILKVSQRMGGVAAGAFDDRGALLGFVYGIIGVERGEVVHWSDMLAVRPEARRHGLGRRLKEYQWDACHAAGVRRIYWTFDPLVARNAHINFAVLGAWAVEYVENMYGETTSVLHRGIGTDRFVVAWAVTEAAPGYLLGREAGAAALDAPFVGDDGAIPSGAEVLRVEVPIDIAAVQAASLSDAAAWRRRTRPAIQAVLAAGYVVAGFHRDEAGGRAFYVFVRHTSP